MNVEQGFGLMRKVCFVFCVLCSSLVFLLLVFPPFPFVDLLLLVNVFVSVLIKQFVFVEFCETFPYRDIFFFFTLLCLSSSYLT